MCRTSRATATSSSSTSATGSRRCDAHLSEVGVKVGDTVETGEKLGLAGCTGYCTGTHLHFELREDGTAVDPAPLLPATFPEPAVG